MRVFAFVCLLGSVTPARADLTPKKLGEVTYLETGPEEGPLLLALHAQRSDPAQMAEFLAARLPAYHIVLPLADPRNGLFNWYVGESTDLGAPTVLRATKRIARFLDALAPKGPARITGYSQGAIIALTLAVLRPDLARLVVAVAGRIPPSLFPKIPTKAPHPIVVTLHGRRDTAVPFSGCEASVSALKKAGWQAEVVEYADGTHALSEREMFDWMKALRR